MLAHKKMEGLLLFIAVAENLSFTKAAQQLGVSKAYLSEQVKRLEQEFNCPLLIRSTRSVRLTEQGSKALSQGLEIRASLVNLERNLGDEQGNLHGLIRITAARMFCQRFLTPICTRFKQIHPQISFSIDCSETSYNLNQNELDLAFRATRLPPESLIATKLIDYNHCFVASKSYIEKFGYPIDAGDLSKHQCMTQLHQDSWSSHSGEQHIPAWIKLNDNQQLKELALQGLGIIRIATYFVQQELDSGELIEVMEHEKVSGQSVFMLQPQLIYPSAKIKLFTSFVREYFQK